MCKYCKPNKVNPYFYADMDKFPHFGIALDTTNNTLVVDNVYRSGYRSRTVSSPIDECPVCGKKL